MRLVLTGLCVASLAGCPSPDDDGCPVVGEPTLEIGVPDSVTFLNFQPLVTDGDIPLSSNGQTFLAAQLAIRVTNMSRAATISMTVTYQPDTGPARVATKDDSVEERLFCRSDDRLYVVPVVVSAEDLGDDIEIADKMVGVIVTVTDDEERAVTENATGVLRRL